MFPPCLTLFSYGLSYREAERKGGKTGQGGAFTHPALLPHPPLFLLPRGPRKALTYHFFTSGRHVLEDTPSPGLDSAWIVWLKFSWLAQFLTSFRCLLVFRFVCLLPICWAARVE